MPYDKINKISSKFVSRKTLAIRQWNLDHITVTKFWNVSGQTEVLRNEEIDLR